MNNLEQTLISTYFLTSFKYLKEDFVVKKFITLLDATLHSNDFKYVTEKFCDFVLSLKQSGEDDFSIYLKNLILKNKTQIKDKKQNEIELEIVRMLCSIQFQDLKNKISEKFNTYSSFLQNLAEFKNSGVDLTSDEINSNFLSAEIYKNYNAFIFNNNLDLEPVEFCDTIKFCNLKGYDEQKRILYKNTSALLNGSKVNNILLYGDAGCGKSSSVRALLNEFQNLKMVQIFKNNLINLDKLYSILKNIPYKFIIFADDISFDETDETFSTMKAILEGSLIQCPQNAVIYATSNRRHLIKETFQSRKGDEIHLNDTINELSSLSERFGINLLFPKPTNEEFCDIVLKLAKDKNINSDEKSLLEKARRLALVKGSNSPRIAKQFIDNLVNNINI